MNMPPPPPPPKRMPPQFPKRIPPTPPPPTPARSVKVSPLVSPFSLTAAVFMFGGYPQVPWDAAVESLKRRVAAETPCGDVTPTALWMLGRRTFGKDYKYL